MHQEKQLFKDRRIESDGTAGSRRSGHWSKLVGEVSIWGRGWEWELELELELAMEVMVGLGCIQVE